MSNQLTNMGEKDLRRVRRKARWFLKNLREWRETSKARKKAWDDGGSRVPATHKLCGYCNTLQPPDHLKCDDCGKDLK